MTDEQLSTLQNFNSCSASFPKSDITISKNSDCQGQGTASYTISWSSDLSAIAPAGFNVAAVNSENNNVAATASSGTSTVALGQGTYNIHARYGNCNIYLSQVEVTCASSPTVSSASVVSGSILLGFTAALMA